MSVFGGSTYARRQAALTGVSSSKKLLISTWFRVASGEGGTLLVGGASGTEYVKLSISTSTGLFTFAVKNSAGTTLWSITSTTDVSDDASHHLGLSVSLGDSRGQVYLDGSAESVTTNTALADGTIAFASANDWVVGADLAGATPFTGQIYDVAFWPGVTIDLSDDDSLQLIVAKDSTRLATVPTGVKPVGYGRQGIYLGETAAILMSDAFLDNFGTGGKFTQTGTVGEELATEALAPNPFRLHPRWQTPGERWYLSEQSGIPYPKGEMFVEQREGLTSYGKRIALEEMDDRTRRERPGMNFTDLVLGVDEDDTDEFLR